MAPNNDLLDNLWRCPSCRGPLSRKIETLVCQTPDCRLSYPIIDRIPVMLIDQATELASDEWNEVVQISAEGGK